MLFSSLPSDIKDRLFGFAKNKVIALPEGADQRILDAAEILKKELNITSVIGNVERAQKQKLKTLEIMQQLAQKKNKKLTNVLENLAADCCFEAGAMLVAGEVDAVVAGCVETTAHVIRSALYTVGLKPEVKTICSTFLFSLREATAGGESLVLFSDCAVIPNPTSEQLSDIAFLAQQVYTTWIGGVSKVSFLSFSTKGSAEHPDVEKVKNAFEIFQKKYPNILAEGEVQFDTAVIPEIAKRKNPNSKILGKTNVFIFPDLDAGNIGYKITERIGGAKAWGPILLGTAKPYSDLSRGATANDIAHVAVLVLAMSQKD